MSPIFSGGTLFSSESWPQKNKIYFLPDSIKMLILKKGINSFLVEKESGIFSKEWDLFLLLKDLI